MSIFAPSFPGVAPEKPKKKPAAPPLPLPTPIPRDTHGHDPADVAGSWAAVAADPRVPEARTQATRFSDLAAAAAGGRVTPPVAPPKPQVANPDGKPVPVLQGLGYHGGIGNFGERVHAVVDAHQAAYGYWPTPDLTLKLALSNVPTDRLPAMFSVPTTMDAARARALVGEATFMRVRPDGLVVHPHNVPGVAPAHTLTDLHRKYPMVQLGILPIASWPKLAGALEDIYAMKGSTPQPTTPVPSHLAPGSPQQQAADYERFQRETGELERAKTIKQAQTELNTAMGTKLPVTGTFGDDWQKAISSWTKSKAYFERSAKFQAEQAGFDSFADYLKAYNAKRGAVQKHGAAQWFLGALPLHAFASGSNPLQVLKHLGSDPFANPTFGPSTPLHALTRTAGEVLDVVGGTVAQTKAYAAAGTAVYNALDPLAGNGSFDDAKAAAKKALLANPSWLRVLDPNLPTDEHGWLKAVDQATNLAGDIILLRKPALTGERVLPGSVEAAARSRYVNRAGGFAYDYLREGRLGRAAAILEGGPGAEKLTAAAAKAVKTGRMTPDEFKRHVAELYATGETTLTVADKAVTVTGPVLSTLRSGHLPTPTAAKMNVQQFVRQRADEFDTGLRKSRVPGTTAAADFTSWLRSEFSHHAPTGSTRGYFDPKLPERVHDFVLRHFGDADLANRYESALVRWRATENVTKIQDIQRSLEERYYAKYNVGTKSAKDDPFEAVLETEAPSRFRFPGGNQKEISNPFDRIAVGARQASEQLNKVAAFHRKVILSGFPLNVVPGAGKLVAGRSLFWKHMVGDTGRRFIGGDRIFGAGLDKTHAEIRALVDSDPALSRAYGAFLARATNSETRYLTHQGVQAVPSFRTADRFKNGNYMEGAGGYLRRALDDRALDIYRQASPTNLNPLVQFVLHDDTYRRLWKASRKASPGLTAEDYAETIYTRYRELDLAAQQAGTSLDDALNVLRANRGAKADAKLGQWIADRKVDFTVTKGQVELGSTFDKSMSDYIGSVMLFNKLNRGGMARNITASVYQDLRAAGWEQKAALTTAMDVGEKQTVYHMLDFANMLQAEQDLRWLSYFATKHRLFWKWVLSTLARNPAAAAAVVDMRQQLDDHGNLNFNVGGVDLAVPAARLVWVPGKEYSETAPVASFVGGFLKSGGSLQGGLNAAGGTFGNILTRSDTAMQLLTKAAGMQAGKFPTTYSAAVAGLDPVTRSAFNREVNNFQLDFFRQHGHYAPQSQAVKRALWVLGAEEMWRSNLPLPVIVRNDRNETQQLLDAYMRLVDPQKKSAFLDQHPELALQFGVSKDPADYQHLRRFWQPYTTALDAYKSERDRIYAQAVKTGMTAELEKARVAASAAFQKAFDRLKGQDRRSTPPARQREVGGERLGLWGQQVSADPLVNPAKTIETLFPNVPAADVQAALPSHLIAQAKQELKLLSNPQWVAKTFDDPAEAKTRQRELLAFIGDYRAFPHDALGKVQDAYRTRYVDPYWKHVETELARIATLGRGDKHLAYAKLRAWKDSQDKPVVVDGVKFPSPIGMAWATLPPDQRRLRLAGAVSGGWDHLADYEKRMLLGRPTKPGLSAAWADFDESAANYRNAYPGHGLGKENVKLLVAYEEKQHPGFRQDWLFAQQPKVDRFERTTLYREMPTDVRQAWDAEIGASAKVTAQVLKQGSPAARVTARWKQYVKEELPGYLDDHPALKRWLAPYLAANPDFLNTLEVK